MNYEQWLAEVKAIFAEWNMDVDSWQTVFPVDFKEIHKTGLSPLDAMKAVNDFWWDCATGRPKQEDEDGEPFERARR